MGWGYIRSSYYILSPWCDEINFCCFICVTRWALQVVIKRQFFTFYICCFSISIHSWGTTTSAFRKQTNAIWKFCITFRFWTLYRHLRVIPKDETNFVWIGQSQRELWRCVDFSRWRIYRHKYSFSFLVLWHLAFRKAKNYLRIKFRQDISIYGQVITTSGWWRQTSAIFKFYSRFRRTLHRHRHVILHWPTKF